MLSGVKVLELSEGVAGPYCAKLLGDLGADVIKVEPPGGDPARRLGPMAGGRPGPERSIPFAHLNTSKRGVRLDIADPSDAHRFSRLAAGSDLVIADRDPGQMATAGLGHQSLLDSNPHLVVLSLTPFGTTGPHRGWKAYPLNTFHGAGEGSVTPVASRLLPGEDERPPLKQGRFAAEYKLATYAALLGLAGVYHAGATGVGQHIDLSKQDALLGLNFFEFQRWLSLGEIPTRTSAAQAFGGLMPCRDGYLQFSLNEEHQWRAMMTLLGDPEWSTQDWAADEQSRAEHADEINALLIDWLRTRDKDDVVRAGRQVNSTVAPYRSIDEVVASEQLRVRQFFRPVSHPVIGTWSYPTGAYRFSGQVPQPGPAPLLGQDDATVLAAATGDHGGPAWPVRGPDAGRLGDRGPRGGGGADGRREGEGILSGVRVLDFTWAVAGPTATMLLAALGAEVIKVESRLHVDTVRRRPISSVSLNRQKKSLTLNLSHPEAVELVNQLVGVSDVVAENFRPGVMERLGLGYEQLAKVRSDLIMLSSSFGGQEGPDARLPGYATMFVALSGLGDMTGYEDGPPSQIRVGGDVIVGLHGAFAVMVALAQHQSTGQGTHIDLSSIEAQSCLIGDSLLEHIVNGTVPSRRGNDEEGLAPHNCYPCAGDNQWISIVAGTPDEWDALVQAMGRPAWTEEPGFRDGAGRWANRAALDGHIGRWTSRRGSTELADLLQGVGVAAVPSYRAPELFADPHVVDHDMVAVVPGYDQTWPLIRMGGRLSANPLLLDRAGPDMGEHNHSILEGLLGLSAGEIRRLEDAGVLT